MHNHNHKSCQKDQKNAIHTDVTSSMTTPTLKTSQFSTRHRRLVPASASPAAQRSRVIVALGDSAESLVAENIQKLWKTKKGVNKWNQRHQLEEMLSRTSAVWLLCSVEAAIAVQGHVVSVDACSAPPEITFRLTPETISSLAHYCRGGCSTQMDPWSVAPSREWD
jgi:hypothetical protein